MNVTPIDARDAMQMEKAISEFASSSNGGLIVTPSAYRRLSGADHHRWGPGLKPPAIYYSPFFATDGGLCSCSPYMIDQYRRAAGYIDRILKGEKPADMPVQAPVKFEFVINLRAARLIDRNVTAGLWRGFYGRPRHQV